MSDERIHSEVYMGLMGLVSQAKDVQPRLQPNEPELWGKAADIYRDIATDARLLEVLARGISTKGNA